MHTSIRGEIKIGDSVSPVFEEGKMERGRKEKRKTKL